MPAHLCSPVLTCPHHGPTERVSSRTREQCAGIGTHSRQSRELFPPGAPSPGLLSASSSSRRRREQHPGRTDTRSLRTVSGQFIMDLTALFLSLCLLSETTLGDKNGVVRVVVKEDSDAILPCSPRTKQNLSGTLFDWRRDNGHKDVFMYEAGIITTRAEEFKGRVSHFTDELKNGNASILIRNTKVDDSGIYTCDLPRLEPPQRLYVQLVVGASPKPNIVIVNATEDGVQLQCEVQGASPKPQVEFQDSAGNILPAEEPQVFERGRRYTVIRFTTVTKTDRFCCVAKQEEIHHETSAETYVPVYG